MQKYYRTLPTAEAQAYIPDENCKSYGKIYLQRKNMRNKLMYNTFTSCLITPTDTNKAVKQHNSGILHQYTCTAK